MQCEKVSKIRLVKEVRGSFCRSGEKHGYGGNIGQIYT